MLPLGVLWTNISFCVDANVTDGSAKNIWWRGNAQPLSGGWGREGVRSEARAEQRLAPGGRSPHNPDNVLIAHSHGETGWRSFSSKYALNKGPRSGRSKARSTVAWRNSSLLPAS